MLKLAQSILIGYVLVLSIACSNSNIQIEKLTIDLAEKPIGISTAVPRFGWVLKSGVNGTSQKAYQLFVKDENTIVWNSDKVVSKQSQFINYKGEKLKPATRYQIELKVWDQEDEPSSAFTSWFETAPHNLHAQWIGAIRREDAFLPKGRGWHSPSVKKNRAMLDSIPDLAKQSIMIRKEINLSKDLKKATVYISGLGHYELSLNGSKVGKSLFAPLWTDYDKFFFYNTYDLTQELNTGQNAFGVILGNGMYNSIGERYHKFWVSFGPPTLFFQLHLQYADGSEEIILSDNSWKYHESPIIFNDIFGGEDYDARLEQANWDKAGFDDGTWNAVVIQDAPKGQLKPQLSPAVEIQEQFEIQDYYQLDASTYVFNMGQNLSGFPSLKVKGKAGQTVKLIVGERIKDDSTINQRNTGGPHYYEYTLKGEGEEEWQPRFSYYGYQYVQVEGVHYGEADNPEDFPELLDLKSKFIYNNAKPLATFECSNEIFTKTHTLINNAIKSNMQAVFTDCPHREKLGWLEEIQLVGPGLLFNYDLTQVFAKQMMDMQDAQRPNGLVPNIAPEYVDFSLESWGADFTDSPEWGAAAVLVPWQYYEFYGDPSLIEKYYVVMRRYVDYLTSRAEKDIVSHGLGDWYDYGDHAAGYSKNSPIPLSSTSHYFLCAQKLAEAAKLIGNTSDQGKYSQLAGQIKASFNREFYNPETKQYGSGSQFCNAVAIYMDLVEPENKEAVLQNLVSDIQAHGNRLTTGDVGNRYLFQALAENGLNELMYTMLNHYDAPGYGYQLKYGLTTLTEQWDPAKGNSWNHFMMGQIEEWFFKSVLGIKPDAGTPGFKHFFIQPEMIGDMTFAKGSFESNYGEIVVDWRKHDSTFEIEITIPVNTTATFIQPEEVINRENLELGSGRHVFNLSISNP